MGLGTNFFDGDGLLRKYGTTKAIPNRGGEYKTFGDLRELEFKIIWGTASAFGSSTVGAVASTDVIQSDQIQFPRGVWVEEVQLEIMEVFNTLTSISVGMVQSNDRSTLIGASGGGFIAAEVLATLTPAGQRVTYIGGTAKAGTLIGTVAITAASTFSGYITARFVGTQGTTGAALVRIKYRVNSP